MLLATMGFFSALFETLPLTIVNLLVLGLVVEADNDTRPQAPQPVKGFDLASKPTL